MPPKWRDLCFWPADPEHWRLGYEREKAEREAAEKERAAATAAMLAATCGPVERAQWEALVTKARNERIAAEARADAAEKERDKWHDCHAGPGTTEPACGACVRCMLQRLTEAESALAGGTATAQPAPSSSVSALTGKEGLEALRALRQQVEDTIGAAQTDSDGEWITAYHFKTGAVHRLLALARDPSVDAGPVYRTARNTEAAAVSGSRLVGQDACAVKAPTPTERAERSALSEEEVRRAAVLMAIRVLGTDWTEKHDRLIEEVEDLAAEYASEQPRAAPVKDPSASLPAGLKDLERAAPECGGCGLGGCVACDARFLAWRDRAAPSASAVPATETTP